MLPDNKPLAKQGIVTTVTQQDPTHVERQIRLASRKQGKDGIYPGGTDRENYRTFRFDILLGRRHAVNRGTSGQQSYESVISSWNGVSHEALESEEDLARQFYFAGINLTDFDPAKEKGPVSGLTTLVSGTQQIRFNSNEDVYAGDALIWVPPPFTSSTRRRKRFTGEPPNKLHTVVKRLDWKDLQKVNQVTFLDACDTSILKLPHNQTAQKGMSNEKRRALALSKHYTMAVMQGIRDLALRGLILPITPSVAARADRVGEKQDGQNLWTYLLGGDNEQTNAITGANATFENDDDYFKDLAMYTAGTLIPGQGVVAPDDANARRRALENSLLWLSARIGATHNQAMSSSKIQANAAVARKSLLKSIHHVYAPFNEQARYTPSFSNIDPNGTSAAVKDYMRCSADTVIEYEQLLSEHKADLGSRSIGKVLRSASADVENPRVDMLIGGYSGNVVV